MANVEGYTSLINQTLSEEDNLIQKTKPASISDAEDRTSISLSNQGIERVEVATACPDSNNSHKSKLHPPEIPQIESSIVTLPQPMMIVRLDLSRNKLTELPKELFVQESTHNELALPRCPMLEYLNVGRNQLKELPSEIGNCKRLKTLVALSNKIRPSGFPLDAVNSLPLLEVLDLRWNQKMNSQSSRRRLIETFLEGDGGDKNQPTTVDLRLSPGIKQKQIRAFDSGVPAEAVKKKLSACDRDANELRSQLEPLSTPQLRKRLQRTFGVSFEDSDESGYDRENVMQKLLRCYNANMNADQDAIDENGHPLPLRKVRHEHGIALEPTLRKELLDEMEAIRWPRTTRERPKISAEGYVILQRPPPALPSSDSSTTNFDPDTSTESHNIIKINNKSKREAEKLKRFAAVWNKAVEAIKSIDEDFASKFTALAVTMNFRGSPHIDTLNIAPFYGVSLGDFEGGKLCVECSPTCVAEIDTRGKFAKVDGRFCHWVSDYEGTRYSLIYYVTHGDVVPQTTAIFEPHYDESFGSEGDAEGKVGIQKNGSHRLSMFREMTERK